MEFKFYTKKTYYWLLILLLIAISCVKSENIDDTQNQILPVPVMEPQNIIDSLNDAYEAQSEEKLKRILDYWHLENQSISTSEIENDTINDIYEIFKVFYTPFNIARLFQYEIKAELYEGLKYIIIQNKIDYDFNLDMIINDKIYSVSDFSPDVAYDSVKTLYFTLNYQIALNAFLGSDNFPFEDYGFTTPETLINDSYYRKQFLNKHLKIFNGHFGNYWHIETHPEIHVIHFDKDMQKVRFYFRIEYYSGVAHLEKKNNKWELISSEIIGVE